MKRYYARISEDIFINANNKKEAIKRIEKYYENLGIYVDIQIKEERKGGK